MKRQITDRDVEIMFAEQRKKEVKAKWGKFRRLVKLKRMFCFKVFNNN